MSITLEWDSIDGPKKLSTPIPDETLAQTWWHSFYWARSYLFHLPAPDYIPTYRPTPDDIIEAEGYYEEIAWINSDN